MKRICKCGYVTDNMEVMYCDRCGEKWREATSAEEVQMKKKKRKEYGWESLKRACRTVLELLKGPYA